MSKLTRFFDVPRHITGRFHRLRAAESKEVLSFLGDDWTGILDPDIRERMEVWDTNPDPQEEVLKVIESCESCDHIVEVSEEVNSMAGSGSIFSVFSKRPEAFEQEFRQKMTAYADKNWIEVE